MSKELVEDKAPPRHLTHDEIMSTAAKLKAELTDDHSYEDAQSMAGNAFDAVCKSVGAEPLRFRLLTDDHGELWLDADTLVKLRDAKRPPPVKSVPDPIDGGEVA